MAWWMERAARLQDEVREDELKRQDYFLATRQEDRLMQPAYVKHLRQDVVLVVCLMDAANRQLNWIGRAVGVCIVILGMMLWRIW